MTRFEYYFNMMGLAVNNNWVGDRVMGGYGVRCCILCFIQLIGKYIKYKELILLFVIYKVLLMLA